MRLLEWARIITLAERVHQRSPAFTSVHQRLAERRKHEDKCALYVVLFACSCSAIRKQRTTTGMCPVCFRMCVRCTSTVSQPVPSHSVQTLSAGYRNGLDAGRSPDINAVARSEFLFNDFNYYN